MKHIYFLFSIFLISTTTKAFANPVQDLVFLQSRMQCLMQTCQQLKDQTRFLALRLNNCEEENKALKTQNEICEARCEKLEKAAQVFTAQNTQLGTEIELMKTQSDISNQNVNDVCSKVQELSANFRNFPSQLDEYLEPTQRTGAPPATEETPSSQIQIKREQIEKLRSLGDLTQKTLSDQIAILLNDLNDCENNPRSLDSIQ